MISKMMSRSIDGAELRLPSNGSSIARIHIPSIWLRIKDVEEDLPQRSKMSKMIVSSRGFNFETTSQMVRNRFERHITGNF